MDPRALVGADLKAPKAPGWWLLLALLGTMASLNPCNKLNEDLIG